VEGEHGEAGVRAVLPGAGAETARFVEVTRCADPATRVPTCPEWTVPELTEHVGRAHRWAATIGDRRAQSVARFRDTPDRDQLLDHWLDHTRF
jgi:hypothetical protein